GQVFVVNWIAGVVHTKLPASFHQRKAAQQELTWCLEHADKAPHPAWLREVYYHVGKLALDNGDTAKAQEYLRRSGYSDFDHPITLATPFSEEKSAGHAFAPRRITEVVPGRVYALCGFEFTEYYFVVSKDRHQLISIDAGTRPDSAKGAYEALQAFAPGLPPLTTMFITHAHWDHVGGHSYFRGLSPRPKFYGRVNYQEEFEKGIQRARGLRETVLRRSIQRKRCCELQTGHYHRPANGADHRRIEVRVDPCSRWRNARRYADLSSGRKSDVPGGCHHAVS